jgi:predicted nuclease with TOPRIM domain
MVNEQVDLKILCGNLKKENKQLKEMLQKWTDENTMLQESLDQCERDLLDLNKEWELVVKRDLG